MVLKNDYSLEVIRNFDDYIDFNICFCGNPIGTLELRVSDVIFIRQISINQEYRRKNHAKNIVNELLIFYQKPVRLCIATSSESAVLFWNNYLKTKNHTHIRGQIYEISA